MGSDEEKELPIDGDSIFCETETKEENHVSAEEDVGPNPSSNEECSDIVHELHENHTSNKINEKDIPIQELIEKALEASLLTTSASL